MWGSLRNLFQAEDGVHDGNTWWLAKEKKVNMENKAGTTKTVGNDID